MDDVSSGKYDPLCEHVMDKAKATAALLLIINGDKGHGMSVCINANEELARDIAKKMPELLRHNLQTPLPAAALCIVIEPPCPSLSL